VSVDIRFIITGQGRSGTMWLARLLDLDPEIKVFHEAGGQVDAMEFAGWHAGSDARRYLLGPRLKRVEQVMERWPGLPFAEVNSYLRYCVPAIREVYDVPVFGIVRDGRYTVRSMLARGIYATPARSPVRPVDPDMLAVWRGMGQFARTCWYWADAYRRLSQDLVMVFTLEGLNTDYQYFSQLCELAGVSIPPTTWRQRAGHPTHVGIPAGTPLGFDDEELAIFEALAGDVQERFGYPI
jgi:hypothetical protein